MSESCDIFANLPQVATIMLKNNFRYKIEMLYLNNKGLKEIPDLSDFVWVTKLYLGENSIKEIKKEHLPPNLKELSIPSNYITSVTCADIPESAELLNLTNNDIEIFDGTGMKLKKLILTKNRLDTIIAFPDECEIIYMADNVISKLPKFPHNLNYINLSNNEITTIKGCIDLNNSVLDTLILNENHIVDFPELPDSIVVLNIKNNKLEYVIENLPDNLKKLRLDNNLINYIELTSFYCELEILNLKKNLLTEYPEKLMDNIEKIYLDDNPIIELNPSFVSPNLKLLTLRNINMEKLPIELYSLGIKIVTQSNNNYDNTNYDYDGLNYHNRGYYNRNYYNNYGNYNSNYYDNHYSNHYNNYNRVSMPKIDKRLIKSDINEYYIIHDKEIVI